ncbi:MAG: hypothetical protein GY764_11435 [Halieaceae bacterium]|nr:hypothetical protein [Halieaceae bacterium]
MYLLSAPILSNLARVDGVVVGELLVGDGVVSGVVDAALADELLVGGGMVGAGGASELAGAADELVVVDDVVGARVRDLDTQFFSSRMISV